MCDQVYSIVNVTGFFEFMQQRVKYAPVPTTNQSKKNEAEVPNETPTSPSTQHDDETESLTSISSQSEGANLIKKRPARVNKMDDFDMKDIEIKIRQELEKMA